MTKRCNGKVSALDQVGGGDLTATIAEIDAMDREALLAEWRRLIGAPPKNLSQRLLRMALNYEVQLAESGLPSDAFERDLSALANGETAKAERRSRLAPGAKLVREWQGRTYVVEAREDGFLLNGQSFRSLSAVAKHITGAHWSGPRFFGLSASTAVQSGRPT